MLAHQKTRRFIGKIEVGGLWLPDVKETFRLQGAAEVIVARSTEEPIPAQLVLGKQTELTGSAWLHSNHQHRNAGSKQKLEHIRSSRVSLDKPTKHGSSQVGAVAGQQISIVPRITIKLWAI